MQDNKDGGGGTIATLTMTAPPVNALSMEM
jgi:hypothetical protein